jgi:hypothetical protein
MFAAAVTGVAVVTYYTFLCKYVSIFVFRQISVEIRIYVCFSVDTYIFGSEYLYSRSSTCICAAVSGHVCGHCGPLFSKSVNPVTAMDHDSSFPV